jgi:hypothetical protein
MAYTTILITISVGTANNTRRIKYCVISLSSGLWQERQ